MKLYITDEEQADCYLEKPLPQNEFVALLKLLNIYQHDQTKANWDTFIQQLQNFIKKYS